MADIVTFVGVWLAAGCGLPAVRWVIGPMTFDVWALTIFGLFGLGVAILNKTAGWIG